MVFIVNNKLKINVKNEKNAKVYIDFADVIVAGLI